jgi:hypothetical protein
VIEVGDEMLERDDIGLGDSGSMAGFGERADPLVERDQLRSFAKGSAVDAPLPR